NNVIGDQSERLCSIVHILDDFLAISPSVFFFFFNDTATTEIYTLSLHDALPICFKQGRAIHLRHDHVGNHKVDGAVLLLQRRRTDRKSTRLNSSHVAISYAVFCLKKKKTRSRTPHPDATSTWPLSGASSASRPCH